MTFQPPSKFAAGQSPVALAVADFNKDGYPDVIAVNSVSNDISVFLSNGKGSFLPATSYSVQQDPINIVVGDFDGNGTLDLAVGNYNSSTISILLGKGNGTFQAAQSFASGLLNIGSTALASGDFNHGGILDLISANSSDHSTNLLCFYYGNGDGPFSSCQQASWAMNAGILPFLAVADLNCDQQFDAVVIDSSASSVSVVQGQNDVLPSGGLTYGTGFFPRGAILGDFNEDGQTDVGVASLGRVTILLNTSE